MTNINDETIDSEKNDPFDFYRKKTDVTYVVLHVKKCLHNASAVVSRQIMIAQTIPSEHETDDIQEKKNRQSTFYLTVLILHICVQWNELDISSIRT